MLLGWECIGCQAAFKIPPNMLSRKVDAPEKCSECGGTLFRRVEGIPGINAHPVYPDRPVTDPAPPAQKVEDASDMDPDDWRVFDYGAREVDSIVDRKTANLPLAPGTWMIFATLYTNLNDDEWAAPPYTISARTHSGTERGDLIILELEGSCWYEVSPISGSKNCWQTRELMVDMAIPGKAILELKRNIPEGVKLTFHTKRIR